MSQRPDGHARDEFPEDLAGTPESNPLSAAAEAAAEKALGEELADGGAELERLQAELDAQKAEHAAMHDKYVRLHAEFDNFRKRTAKERLELLASAGADTIKSILPVLDDMERAVAHNAEVTDIEAVKKGFELIQQKFSGILTAQGLKRMEAKGQPFDADLHEAISQVPAPSPELKGKVLDVVETGYLLNDKVLRYAKVVVGQ
jgi:molecular chaperone GrpE